MKTFTLAFCLLFIKAQSQKRLDNTIVIDTSLSMQAIKGILFTNGYMVEGQDTMFIMTSPKGFKWIAGTIKLNIARTDTGLIVKGQRKFTAEVPLWGVTIKEEYEPVRYIKAVGSFERDCWDELNRMALLFGKRIRYLKQ